jgi:hypothetical protein
MYIANVSIYQMLQSETAAFSCRDQLLCVCFSHADGQSKKQSVNDTAALSANISFDRIFGVAYTKTIADAFLAYACVPMRKMREEEEETIPMLSLVPVSSNVIVLV